MNCSVRPKPKKKNTFTTIKHRSTAVQLSPNGCLTWLNQLTSWDLCMFFCVCEGCYSFLPQLLLISDSIDPCRCESKSVRPVIEWWPGNLVTCFTQCQLELASDSAWSFRASIAADRRETRFGVTGTSKCFLLSLDKWLNRSPVLQINYLSIK